MGGLKRALKRALIRLLYYLPMEMDNCRRCGKKIVDGKLWCSKCKEKVDDELKGGIIRPLEYYFKWYLKHVKPKK